VARRPRQAIQLFGGSSGVTLFNALALAASLAAFRAGASLDEVIVVYLGGSAVASVSPTPGSLGAVEAALVAGLTGVGVAAGPAVAGVLAFRLITFWLPSVPGFVAYRAARRRAWV
jgi:undecaprenyl-diphosphatase